MFYYLFCCIYLDIYYYLSMCLSGYLDIYYYLSMSLSGYLDIYYYLSMCTIYVYLGGYLDICYYLSMCLVVSGYLLLYTFVYVDIWLSSTIYLCV